MHIETELTTHWNSSVNSLLNEHPFLQLMLASSGKWLL